MDIRELINEIEQYGGDVKRMEMDKRINELRGEDEVPYPKEELRKLSESSEIKVQYPLSVYSTTELKKELRRRKGK